MDQLNLFGVRVSAKIAAYDERKHKLQAFISFQYDDPDAARKLRETFVVELRDGDDREDFTDPNPLFVAGLLKDKFTSLGDAKQRDDIIAIERFILATIKCANDEQLAEFKMHLHAIRRQARRLAMSADELLLMLRK